MAEPSTTGLVGLAVGGVSSGLVIAAAAVQNNPEIAQAMTPPIGESLGALAVAVCAYVLRAYMPSEKRVEERFDILEKQHVKLSEAIQKTADESREFRTDLSRWMGSVDAKLDGMNGRVDHLEDRKAS